MKRQKDWHYLVKVRVDDTSFFDILSPFTVICDRKRSNFSSILSHDAYQNLGLDETNTLILFIKVRIDDTDNIDLKSNLKLM